MGSAGASGMATEIRSFVLDVAPRRRGGSPLSRSREPRGVVRPPPRTASDELPVPGARAIDHTADIGIEVEARDLPKLFERAALAAVWMALEASAPSEVEGRMLRLSAGDLPSLLRRWLQEILYWQDVDGVAPSKIHFTRLEEGGRGHASVEATVGLGRIESRPVREIKGVTFHGLVVERRAGGWFARVVFDV